MLLITVINKITEIVIRKTGDVKARYSSSLSKSKIQFPKQRYLAWKYIQISRFGLKFFWMPANWNNQSTSVSSSFREGISDALRWTLDQREPGMVNWVLNVTE